MTSRETIPIQIVLPHADGAEAGVFCRALMFGVGNYANGLIEDLGLTAKSTVGISVGLDGETSPRMSINGREARLDSSRETDERDRLEQLCWEVYRNRDLIVSSARRSSTKARAKALQNISRNTDEHTCEPKAKIALNERWKREHWDDEISRLRLQGIQTDFFRETQVPCSAPAVDTDDRLAYTEFRIELNDVRLPTQSIRERHPFAQIYAALTQAMAEGRVGFLTESIFETYIKHVEQQLPRLVAQVREKIGLQTVYDVLLGLLEEGISLRNLDRILETFTLAPCRHEADGAKYIVFGPQAELALTLADDRKMTVADWVRFVRSNLKREISHQYSQNLRMEVYLLDPQAEKRIHARTPGSYRKKLIAAIREEIGSETVVILTSEEVRRPLWELVSRELPRAAVLTYQELSPDLTITPIARITPDS